MGKREPVMMPEPKDSAVKERPMELILLKQERVNEFDECDEHPTTEETDYVEPKSEQNEDVSPSEELDLNLKLEMEEEEFMNGESERSRKRKTAQLSSDIMLFLQQKQNDELELWRQQQQLKMERLESEKQERMHRIKMERKQQTMLEKIINLLGNKL